MRGILPLAIVPALLASSLAACGAERAVRVEIEIDDASSDADSLCLVAYGDHTVVFASAYELAALPPGERSLTFVAGARVDETLAISALVLRGGVTTARATSLARFTAQGTVRQVLRPLRCRPGGPAGLGARPAGAFAALAPSPHMLAADLDGDGLEELLAIAADGSLQVLDAEERASSSRRATELRAPEGVLVAAGDVDGDCRIDLVAAAPTGALVVHGDDGRSPSPVGGAATDAVLGVRADDGSLGIAIVGPDGLTITPSGEDAPRTVAAGVFSMVRAGDLTGDGDADLVVSGEAGTRVLVAQGGSFREEPGALPAAIAASTGPFAIGDLDGDGTLDLVSAEGPALRVALNRGDGLLEDRSGVSPPMLAADPVRMAITELDADCAEEIVVLDAAGALVILGRDARGAWIPRSAPAGTWVDAVVVDADGDGSSEIAMLDAAGAVTLWRP